MNKLNQFVDNFDASTLTSEKKETLTRLLNNFCDKALAAYDKETLIVPEEEQWNQLFPAEETIKQILASMTKAAQSNNKALYLLCVMKLYEFLKSLNDKITELPLQVKNLQQDTRQQTQETIATPGEKITTEKQNEILAKTEIRARHTYALKPTDLPNLNLEPTYCINAADHQFYASKCSLAKGRKIFVLYLPVGNKYVARVVYASRSSLFFRSLPAIIPKFNSEETNDYKVDTFFKGHGEGSLTLTWDIQKALWGIVKNTTALEQDVKVFSQLVNIHYLADKEYTEKKQNTVMATTERTGLEVTTTRKREAEEIRFKEGFEPVFSESIDTMTVPSDPDLYGKATLESYYSKNRSIRYTIARDHLGRVFIAGAELAGKELGNDTLLAYEWVELGPLSNPVMEYYDKDQKLSLDLFNGLLTSHDHHYQDTFDRYWRHIPIIQEYYRIKNLTPPDTKLLVNEIAALAIPGIGPVIDEYLSFVTSELPDVDIRSSGVSAEVVKNILPPLQALSEKIKGWRDSKLSSFRQTSLSKLPDLFAKTFPDFTDTISTLENNPQKITARSDHFPRSILPYHLQHWIYNQMTSPAPQANVVPSLPTPLEPLSSLSSEKYLDQRLRQLRELVNVSYDNAQRSPSELRRSQSIEEIDRIIAIKKSSLKDIKQEIDRLENDDRYFDTTTSQDQRRNVRDVMITSQTKTIKPDAPDYITGLYNASLQSKSKLETDLNLYQQRKDLLNQWQQCPAIFTQTKQQVSDEIQEEITKTEELIIDINKLTYDSLQNNPEALRAIVCYENRYPKQEKKQNVKFETSTVVDQIILTLTNTVEKAQSEQEFKQEKEQLIRYYQERLQGFKTEQISLNKLTLPPVQWPEIMDRFPTGTREERPPTTINTWHGLAATISNYGGPCSKYPANEDSLLLHSTSAATTLVVIDGMGSYGGGAVASQLINDEIVYHITNNQTLDTAFTKTRQLVRDLHVPKKEYYNEERNQYYIDSIFRDDAVAAGFQIKNGQAEIVTTGDAKALVIRNGQITYESLDQSKIQREINEGKKTPQARYTDHDSHMVTNCFSREHDFVKTSLALSPGDFLVAYSDGVADFVTPYEIAKISTQYRTAAELQRWIFDTAKQRNNSFEPIQIEYAPDQFVTVDAPNCIYERKPYHTGDNITVGVLQYQTPQS